VIEIRGENASKDLLIMDDEMTEAELEENSTDCAEALRLFDRLQWETEYIFGPFFIKMAESLDEFILKS